MLRESIGSLEPERISSNPGSRARWTEALGMLSIGVLIVIVGFGPTWLSMAKVWWVDETFSHGFLVLPICLWLAWRKRSKFAPLLPRSSAVGAAVLIAATGLWAAGAVVNVKLLQHVAVVSMLPGLVLAFMGRGVARAAAFPLCFVFFMVPAGGFLVPWLMDRTADATVIALRATGIPVFREALYFTLPTGRWSVVEACSGLRYVITALMLSSLFAYLNFSSAVRRWAFVAVAVALAVVANWVRAYLVVLLGHFSNMQLGTGADHIWYGWAFFGLFVSALFWAGSRFGDAGTGLDGSVTKAWSAPAQSPRIHRVSWIMMLVALSASTLFVNQFVVDVHGRPLRTAFAQSVLSDLGAQESLNPALEPQFEGSRDTARGVLDASTSTEAYLAYFSRQSEGNEMVTHGNSVLPHSDHTRRILEESDIDVPGNPGVLPVRSLRVLVPEGEKLVWYWYTVGGRATRSEYGAKLLTLLAVLEGVGDDSTISVLTTDMEPDIEAAKSRLAAHARAMNANIVRHASTPL